MANEPKLQLAIIIPAYNEAATIREIASQSSHFANRVIVVNDGSRDDTAAALDGLSTTIITNTSNIGKGASLRRGARYALEQGANMMITLDGDGQHRPEDIPLLIDAGEKHPDKIIVAARLRGRKAAPPLRRFANRFADFWISWAAGHRIRDSQSGFRLYPASVFRQYTGDTSGFAFESEILIDAAHQGTYTENVTIDTIYSKNARPSHYRPTADTLLIVRMVAWKLLRRGLYLTGLLRSLGFLKHT